MPAPPLAGIGVFNVSTSDRIKNHRLSNTDEIARWSKLMTYGSAPTPKRRDSVPFRDDFPCSAHRLTKSPGEIPPPKPPIRLPTPQLRRNGTTRVELYDTELSARPEAIRSSPDCSLRHTNRLSLSGRGHERPSIPRSHGYILLEGLNRKRRGNDPSFGRTMLAHTCWR